MGNLNGKKALVLGGSRGIGAAIVRALARDGASVEFTYLSAGAEANQLAEQTGGLAVQADSADRQAVTSAVAGADRIDILVVNCGITLIGDPLTLDPAVVDNMIDVNMRAPYFASVEAARHMPDGGRIILIGSTMADALPFAGAAAYAATKAALHGMARGLARDLGDRAITVNVVQPGPTDTDSNPADGPNAPYVESLLALKRFITPGEIGDYVSFLAGPAGRSITGTTQKMDAGFGL